MMTMEQQGRRVENHVEVGLTGAAVAKEVEQVVV